MKRTATIPATMAASTSLAAAVVSMALGAGTAGARDLFLVGQGVSNAPIVVADTPSTETLRAANTLAEYMQKISGVRPDVMQGTPNPLPAHAIWIGVPPAAATLFPDPALDFTYPEEILIVCNGRHLLIAGRDRMVGETQVEFGTANAVYTFLQKYLDVRWFQPWDRDGVWTDLIQRETLTMPEFVYRFHPPFRQRLFWPGRTEDWDRFQRLKLGSYQYTGGHAYTKWWEAYHADHPEWFALRPTGTRTPESWGGKPNAEAVKLCVSNPEIPVQWLENAEAALRADPTRITVSASPNDGGGFCTCPTCRAWDHPDGPLAGADRYVRYWNILARGLRERCPDRDAWVGAYAYSAYQNPPLAQTLEKNIAIGYVGHFPLANDEVTEREKTAWKGWAETASAMVYRPNLFHYSGGFLGLPTVAMHRTIRDFRFLAENKCIGLQVDSLPHSFQTQGVQYYLMAQLAYDPFQDGEALLKDYYRRAFGPAADDIAAYFDLMEEAHEQILNTPGFRHSSGAWRELIDTCRQVYTPDLLAAADECMARAVTRVANGPARFAPRVAYLQKGLEFTQLQVKIMHVMKQIRDTHGDAQEAAVQEAIALCERRDAMVKAGEGSFRDWYKNRVQEYMGPPSEETIRAASYPAMQFLPAQWKLAWSDPFDRDTLGPDWKVLDGDWFIADGQLVTTGGVLLSTRAFPGLQRLEFQATVTPNPGISDMSPIIHCGADTHSSGYLLQFGGYNNSRNSIQRKGRELLRNGDFKIEAGTPHSIVAEYDGSNVRLTVDGQTVLEYADPQPLVGPDHEHVGFYVYEGNVKINEVKVFTSAALTQD